MRLERLKIALLFAIKAKLTFFYFSLDIFTDLSLSCDCHYNVNYFILDTSWSVSLDIKNSFIFTFGIVLFFIFGNESYNLFQKTSPFDEVRCLQTHG